MSEQKKNFCYVLGAAAFAVVAILFIFRNSPWFGYLNHGVATNEIGIEIQNNRFVGVLQPGLYSDAMKFRADIVNVDVGAIPFTVEDPEVLTAPPQLQRVGLVVSGTVRRPRFINEEQWSLYSAIYTNDDALNALINKFALQAMKTCVGERTFEEAAVGSSRDDVALCIQGNASAPEIHGGGLQGAVEIYGLTIESVTVPNIIIPLSVQEQLDELTRARNNTQLEVMKGETASAEANRNEAEQRGIVQVEEARVQELAIQRERAASLEADALRAEADVIAARIQNNIDTAQGKKEVAQVEVEIAVLRAQIHNADEAGLAQIIQDNPEYSIYLKALARVDALAQIDVMVVPEGSELILTGNNVETFISK